MNAASKKILLHQLLDHEDFVRRIAEHLMGSAEADDVVQATWLSVLRTNQPPKKIRPWLAEIVRNVVRLDHRSTLRREKRERAVHEFGAVPSAEDILIREEQRRLVVDAVLALNEPLRAVILLRYFEGLPIKEISERLQISHDTVRERLNRGLLRLRYRLQDDSRDVGGLTVVLTSLIGRVSPKFGFGYAMKTKVASAITIGVVGIGLIVSQTRDANTSTLSEPQDPSRFAVLAASVSPPPNLVPLTLTSSRRVLVRNSQGSARHSAPSRDRYFCTGRVIDGQHFPVANASVNMSAGTQGTATTTTDENGRFCFEDIERHESEWITAEFLARASGGRLGVRAMILTPMSSLYKRSLENEVGDIVLLETSALIVEVVHEGRLIPNVDVRVEYGIRRLEIASGMTHSAGVAEIPNVPDGVLSIVVGDQGDLRGFRQLKHHAGDSVEVVRVEVSPPEVVIVHVVEVGRGRIPHATFLAKRETVSPYSKPSPPEGWGGGERVWLEGTTDDNGTMRLKVRRGQEIMVTAITDEHFPEYWIPVVGGTDKEVFIKLKRRSTVRYEIQENEHAPPDGSIVEIIPESSGRLNSTPQIGTIDGTHLVLEGCALSSVRALAKTAEGAYAELSNLAVIAFQKPRSLELTIRDLNGDPVSGLQVNVTKEHGVGIPRPISIPQCTDDRGVVLFEELPIDRVRVEFSVDGYGTHRGGVFELPETFTRGELTYHPPVPIELTLRIEGKPAIPPWYILTTEHSPSHIRPRSEDPETGKILFGIPSNLAGTATLYVRCGGFEPVSFELKPSHDNVSHELSIDLVPTADLKVTVFPPRDGRYEIQTSVRTEDRWTHASEQSGGPLDQSDPPVYALWGLRKGYYRIVDRYSGLTRGPFTLEPSAQLEVFLDLSMVITCSGRVNVPEGTTFENIQIQVESSGMNDRSVEVNNRDGTFSFRIPGDRLVTLLPVHPWLIAEKELEVIRPKEPLELNLQQGHSATMALDGPQLGLNESVSVRLNSPQGTFSRRAYQVLDEDSPTRKNLVRLGGYETGTYDIWIDYGSNFQVAPLLLKGVQLHEGITDLGTVSFIKGSSVEVSLVVGKGQKRPKCSALIRSIDEPTYSRFVHSEPASAGLTLHGLGAGRFELTIRDRENRVIFKKSDIALDGVTDTDITVDLESGESPVK